MNLRRIILSRPGRLAQIGLWSASLACVGAVGYLHLLSGLGYEFHLFFILPVLVVAWFVSIRRAYVLAVLTVVLWYLADRQLGGEGSDRWPLLFNTLVRISILGGAVWLLARMRGILERETRLARQDNLTGLANRLGFHQDGEFLLNMARRQAIPVSALFIDLDHFKTVNDRFGHETGDRLLARVAAVLRERLRASDLAGRLGGDEFALILPGTGATAAADYAAALRERLLEAMREDDWPVTFSIGVASFATPPADLATLVREADRLMYTAKHDGRDCIRSSSA